MGGVEVEFHALHAPRKEPPPPPGMQRRRGGVSPGSKYTLFLPRKANIPCSYQENYLYFLFVWPVA